MLYMLALPSALGLMKGGQNSEVQCYGCYFSIELLPQCYCCRRDALQKWKQVNGSTATYRNLIRVFEKAGYKGYADNIVRSFISQPGEYHMYSIMKVDG